MNKNIFFFRVITSLILAFFTLFSVIFGGALLLFFISLFVALLTFEWVIITEKKLTNTVLLIKIFSNVACVLIVYFKVYYPIIILFLLLPIMISFFKQTPKNNFLYVVIGPLYICLPILLLYQIRIDHIYGLEIVLWCLCITWSTDIFSYLGGKLFKGPKLSKFVSPNKTWSGFILGIISAIIFSILGFKLTNYELQSLLIWSFLLALSVQLGDLFESLIKRYHGVKDSSKLLPGHGGVLDRMDGFIFCAFSLSIGVYFI